MKKYLVLLLIPLAIYFYWGRKESVSSAPDLTPKIHQKISKNKKVFYGKRNKLKLATVTPDDPCEAIRSSLDDMDFMQESQDWLSLKELEQLPACLAPEFQGKLAEVKANCFEKKKQKDLCITNLVMLRGILRAMHIKDAETRSDLADLMMSEFAKPVPDFKMLKKLAQKLLDQDPNDLPVQKVWAMSAVVASGDLASLKDRQIEEIYNVLDRNVIENDPEMTGLDTILKTKLQPQSVEEFSRQKLLQNPQDFKSQEMLGWSLWQQGRREEAIAQVDAILAKNEDPWLRDLRKKLTEPNADRNSYQGRINIGVRLEDLWE